MTPFKEDGQHSVLEMIYNWKHKHKHFVIKNTFKTMKKNFKKLLKKYKLLVIFILDLLYMLIICTTC
jgi:hypothetical protein